MKQLFTHFLFFCCLLFFETALSQTIPPLKNWDKTYGGSSGDYLTVVRATTDGGYMLGGYSFSDSSGDKSQNSKGYNDYWIIKVDPLGNKEWDKTLGGDYLDYFSDLQQTEDGGYILGGYSTSAKIGDKSEDNRGNPNFSDYWIIKIDACGNKQWDKTYGGNENDYLMAVQQTSDGGFILGGYSFSDGGFDKSQDNTGFVNYWIIKVDSFGNKEWDKTIGGSNADYLSKIQQTVDSGFILGGYSNSDSGFDKSENSRGGFDYWIVKIDQSGNKEWDKVFGGDWEDQLTTLRQTDDNGFILAGFSQSDSSGDKSQSNIGSHDYWVVRIDKFGNKKWDKTFGGINNDELKAVLITRDKGYLLGGYSNSDVSGDKTEPSLGGYDYWIVKTDSAGNKEWDTTFGGSDNDVLNSLTGNMEDEFLLGGYSYSDSSDDKSENRRGNDDYWILKTTPACVLHTFYADGDGDGFGNPLDTISVCDTTPPSGYVTDNTDCDDTKLLYADNDGDGYGAGSPVACGVDNNTDCDDSDASVHSPQTYYRDADGDDFGNPLDTISVCATTPPSGYVTDNTDCDDTKVLYADNDGDGYGAGSPVACGVDNNTDCNDNDPNIHPGATEICGNGIDDNCNGEIDEGCTVDNGIRIMIKDNSIYEGNRSTKYMQFRVVLNKKSNDQITVNYTTQDGTAIAGSDYYAKSGTVIFPKRTKKIKISIGIIGDNIPEPNETFTINLSNPVNASIEKGIAVGTIVNDDGNMISKPNGEEQHQSISVEQQSIKLIPNPAQSKVNVELSGFKGKVSVELRSLDGRLLKVENVSANAKSVQQQIDISNYSAGTYFITATDENGNRKVEKLVILK